MGDLTKNISRHELACKCGCGLDTMDWQTIQIVQRLCDEISPNKVSLAINSAARCVAHNKAVGGGKNSQHLKCRAMDIAIKGIHPGHLEAWLDVNYPDSLGLGLYDTFVHIDTRGTKARW